MDGIWTSATMIADDKIDLVIDDPKFKLGGNNKRYWLLLCGLVLVGTVAIFAGIVAWTITWNKGDTTCTSSHCVITAGELLSNIDPTVDPCNNFYEFACGGWLKKHTIPEDYSSFGIPTKLDDQVNVVLKDLLEKTNPVYDKIEAIKKAKDMYNSCMDLDRIEKEDAKPLINLLNNFGGWPVLGNQEGMKSWNEADFDYEALLAQLKREIGDSSIIDVGVGEDLKNSSVYVLAIDESGPVLTRDYYLDEEYADYKKAYADYMIAITTLLGADEATAKTDMTAVLEFETTFANLTTPPEERRNVSEQYNPTNIEELEQAIPEIDWTRLLNLLLPEETKPISRTEKIINSSPNKTAELVKLIRATDKRVIANYMMWSLSTGIISSLSKKFRDARHEFTKVLSGTNAESPRWRSCVGTASSYLGFSTGRMYIDEYFTGDSKKNIDELVTNVKKAFKGMLVYNDWMDDVTKDAAREKCDAVKEQIGFPLWIQNDTVLNEYYQEIEVNKDEYFESKYNFWQFWANEQLSNLRKPVEKGKWGSGPAIVNAWYSPSQNSITFPAAVLQPPFYHAESPWYLNYGGIGTVIGHELTHGFDDQGRQFNKDGDSVIWWSQASIAKFEEREQCIIDQYSQYKLPENNKTIKGAQTQGENIADNGGIREAFKAYKDNDYPDIKLPGLEKYSATQLFFISFAQVWCEKNRPNALDDQIETDPHSPGRFRVIGTLHNQEAFAKAYNCPANSYMNPPVKDKCVIW